MPTTDPINEHLLGLLSARASEQKAQLDLDVAKAHTAALGRTAVPNVIEALQQRAIKKAKQREAMKGQPAPQPSPQSMLPPTTQPTGLPQGSNAAASMGAAADILKSVLGGGGAKRAGAPGAVAGGTTGAPAGGGPLTAMVGAGTPIGAAAGETMLGPQSPVPGTQQQAPVSPVSITPSGIAGLGQATQTLTPGQKWLAGLTGALNIGARRFGDAATGIMEAKTGQRDLGLVKVPTPQELAAPHAQSLAELQILKDRSEDPEVQKKAGELYDQRLDDLRQEAIRSGVDPDQAVNTAVDLWSGKALEINRKIAEKQATEMRADMRHDEDARQELALRKDAELYAHGLRVREQQDREERAALRPRNVLAQQQLDAVSKFRAQGKDALTLEERGSLPPGMQAAIEKDEKVPISATERSRLEQQVENARKNMNNASLLANAWNPEYYGWNNTLAAYRLSLQQNAGIPMKPDEEAWLTRYRDHEMLLKQLQSDRVRSEAGAQISPAEWKLMDGTSPQPGDDRVTARARLTKYKELWGLIGMREELSLESGYGEKAFSLADEANGGLNFSDMSKLVETFANHAVLDLQLKHPTMDKLQALDIVEKAVRNRWGLEVKNYLGTSSEPVR